MRRAIRRVSAGGWRVLIGVSAMGLMVAMSAPPAIASELFPGFSGSGSVARDDAWAQAGAYAVEPAVASARSFDPYRVDLCSGVADGCAAESSEDPAACPDASDGGDGIGCCDTTTGGCCDPSCRDSGRRFYITGIIGASFGVLQSGGINEAGGFPNTGRASDSLFTAGGAVGTAIDRDDGMLRFEVEGRGRDALQGYTNSFEPPVPTYFYAVRAVDGWSVMANAWRDWQLTERFGVYTGGGIGAGGYRLTVSDGVVSGYGHMAGFAWQAGTGTTFQLTERTTLDLGYRFFDTVSDSLPLSNVGVPAGSYVSNFYASELLLSVRIYEPFRR
ncbi:MAG: outer membrane protein [Planctomycetia bacterium]